MRLRIGETRKKKTVKAIKHLGLSYILLHVLVPFNCPEKHNDKGRPDKREKYRLGEGEKDNGVKNERTSGLKYAL